MTHPLPARVALLAILLAAGCGERDPLEGTLAQNVGASFAPCNASEIKFLAAKHNVMTSFEPCGNNNFQHYAWSPDGRMLYFQLVMVAHVMNAEADDKAVITVPTETPIGPAGWLSSSRLAIPVGPREDDGPKRLVLFDMEQRSLFEHPLPGVDQVHVVTRGASSGEVLLLVSDASGQRSMRTLDASDGSLSPAFPFVEGPVDTFTYTPQVDALAVTQGDRTTLYVGATGERRGTFAPAVRGTVHPDGRWLALEHAGDPVSIFYQRAWDELPERARERELARAKRFEEQLAMKGDFPTEVRPPTVSFVDLTEGERWQLTSIYGRGFQWYEATPMYGSLMLWGFEGKEFKRNVVLGNMNDRLRTITRKGTMMGVERMESGQIDGFVPALWAKRAPQPTTDAPPSDEG